MYTAEEQQALDQAKATGKPVPVASTTTETTQSVANPDGTLTLTSTREAVRTKNSAGAWVPIDTTLSLGSDGRVKPAATTLDLTLSNGGTSPAISLHKGQTGVDLSMPFTLPKPTLNGPTATYSEVLPGVDLQLTAHPEHVAQVLVVKNAAAAAQPALAKLQLATTTTGGTLTVADDGSSTVTDPSGTIVFRAAPPSMWDSRPDTSGTPTATRSADTDHKILATATPAASANRKTATSTASASTDNKTVTLTPDPAAMTGSDVVYPLYLDPSLGFNRWNYLVVRSSGQNYWNNGDVLRVGYCAWAGCTPYAQARSYVDFAYTLTPRNGIAPNISGASITFTQVSAALGGTPVVLHRSSQVSSGTGWPGPAGDGIQSLNPAGGAGVVVRFDNYAVRNYAQDASSSGTTTFTFALTAANESDANQWKKFDNNPVLNVDYTYRPITPTNLTVQNANICNSTTWVNTTNPTLLATVSDNGQHVTLHEDFDFYHADGTWIESATVDVNADQTLAQWTPPLPAGGLAEGKYYFVTRSSINGVYSPDVRSDNFTVLTTGTSAPTAYSPDFPQNNVQAGQTGVDRYGMTVDEAHAQPATFTLISTDPHTVAFAYKWDGDTAPSPSACPATSPLGSSQGFVLATNKADNLKTAIVTYPTATTSIPTKLVAWAVTAANTTSSTDPKKMSAPTTYTIHAFALDGGSPSTHKVEATPPQFATSMTTAINQANPDILSDGSQVRLTTTASGQTATHTVAMPSEGNYALTIEFGTSPTSGNVTLTASSAGTCTQEANATIDVNLYSTAPGKLAITFLNEDPAGEKGSGWTCPAGGGTIAYTLKAKDPSPQTIDIDYVRGLNDSPTPAPAATLAPGAILSADQELAATSGSNHYRLRLKTDCDLVLYTNGLPTWSTGTSRADTQCNLTMQSTDGNLALYPSTGAAIWNANTQSYPGATLTLQTDGNLAVTRNNRPLWTSAAGYLANQLSPGQELPHGDQLYTANRIFKLAMQDDCNLVIYQGASAIWTAPTLGHTNCRAAMQTDGNFVVYSGTTPIWWTGTQGQSIKRLTLDTDGHLRIITTNNTTAWTT